jgi:hypothetical protein
VPVAEARRRDCVLLLGFMRYRAALKRVGQITINNGATANSHISNARPKYDASTDDVPSTMRTGTPNNL